ncbi:MAG: L7Ae/L30e/S12e/Gadd45 family ribosomal protein [Bacillota bacterium]
MTSDRVLNMIGLARKAGKVESGDAAVRDSLKRGRARLLVLAGDAADRTKKEFTFLAGDAGIPLIIYGTKVELGIILSKPSRSVVSVTDDNFARGIVGALEKGGA